MGKKFCMSCGFGADMMAGGGSPNFCPKCGQSFSASLDTYAKRASKSIIESSTTTRRSRANSDSYGEEIDDWGTNPHKKKLSFQEACQKFNISVDVGKPSSAKLADLMQEGKTSDSFARPKGTTDAKSIEKVFKQEASSSKNSPDIIGG